MMSLYFKKAGLENFMKTIPWDLTERRVRCEVSQQWEQDLDWAQNNGI